MYRMNIFRRDDIRHFSKYFIQSFHNGWLLLFSFNYLWQVSKRIELEVAAGYQLRNQTYTENLVILYLNLLYTI